MKLNGKSISEPEPPPSFKWLEKHHPGRAIDLDERDFTEEVWNAAQLAVLTPLLRAEEEKAEFGYCVHKHSADYDQDGVSVPMVNIADTEKDPKAVTLRCPECGWIPVEVAS